MTRFVAQTPLEAPADAVWAWHARPGAFERLSPPWAPVRVVAREGGVEDGTVDLRMRGPLGVPTRWVARHRDARPGRSFCDEQIRGPFRRWVHRHLFEPTGPNSCLLVDEIDWALPLGGLGRLAAGAAVGARLERVFAFRHRRTAEDLARHIQAHDARRLRVAVTGASGLVGAALCAFLTTGGHEVVALARDARRGAVRWDPATGAVDGGALEDLDAVVHLAGAPVAAGRWTASRKRAIASSRAEATRCLARTLAGLARPPRVFVCASAVGVYGDRGEESLDERSPPGTGFLAETALAWEAAAATARRAGSRVACLRFGLVLSSAGGALPALARPVRLGMGGPVAGGRAWWPWVALDDAVGAVLHVLRDDALEGPVVVAAPEPARQGDFVRVLGAALARPAWAPTPGWAVRAVMGERAEALVLASRRARPSRLLERGYKWLRPDLGGALAFEYGRAPALSGTRILTVEAT